MGARVTVVMAPRERFGYTQEALEALYRDTAVPFELIYMSPPAPGHVRRYLARQARAKGFRLLEVPAIVPDSELRNLGLREVTTPYAVFIENDVVVRPGWLDALLRCADETGAAAVGPLYLEQVAGREIVHMAGGLCRVEESAGTRRCIERHHLPGRAPAEVVPTLHRTPTELIEFHCVLVRTDVVRALGGFDEGVKNTAQHVDFCLALQEAGHPIYFEPASVVTYVQPPPFAWSDLSFYCTRWSDEWSRQTVEHLGRKWRLDPDDPFLRDKYEWTMVRRRQIIYHLFARARVTSVVRPKAARRLIALADDWIARTIGRPRPGALEPLPTR